MKKSMKSKLAMFAIAGAMAVSGTVGIAAPAKAENVHTNNAGTVVTCKESYSNTDNELFTFSNNNSGYGYSSYRRKYNKTKVYVYPTVGPKLSYTVMGSHSSKGTNPIVKSDTHIIPLGIEASITNMVNEKGYAYAGLRMHRTVKAQTDSKGWWSPDSTRNYTIYD